MGYRIGALLVLALSACGKSDRHPSASEATGGGVATSGTGGAASIGGMGGSLSAGAAGTGLSAGSGGTTSGGGSRGISIDAGDAGNAGDDGSVMDSGSTPPPDGEDGADADATFAGDRDPLGDAPPAACEAIDGGTPAQPAHLDLNINASGFAEHEGQTVLLVTRASGEGVLGSGRATVKAGAFTFHFPKGYRRATAQEVLWLLDADGNGVCDEAAGDHTGFAVVSSFDPPGDAAAAITISDNHVRTTASGGALCIAGSPFGDMFDMDVTGTGFDAHEGRTVRLLASSLYNGAIFAVGDASVSAGGFALHFPRGYQRFTYEEVFFFVDVDGDGSCTQGVDHPGYISTAALNPTQNVPVAVSVRDNHVTQSSRGIDVCAVMNGCQFAR